MRSLQLALQLIHLLKVVSKLGWFGSKPLGNQFVAAALNGFVIILFTDSQHSYDYQRR